MVLDCVTWTDDACAVQTAGFAQGGTAIGATLIKDDDGIIDTDSSGNVPYLRRILLGEVDVYTDEIVDAASWSLRPNKWPSTERLTGVSDFNASEITDSAAATQHPNIQKQLWVEAMHDMKMEKGLSWISSDSKVCASLANPDVALIWAYSYGERYPYRGGNLIRVTKVADGATAAADVFDEAWSTTLQGVGSGLDNTKNYVLRGIGYHPAAKDKLSLLARAGLQKGEHKIIGFGPGNMLSFVETIYLFDGIPCRGDDGFKAETLGGATDTPWVTLIFEEWGPR
ncbi:MAG: hypothetical protein ACYTBZ_24380 [Planctomycetota bacterium]|jgi:hypothetical protein